MAKLLYFLFLAGFVFQANAFSLQTEEPDIDDSPIFDWISSIDLRQVKSYFEDVTGINIESLYSKITDWVPDSLISVVKGIFPDDLFSRTLDVIHGVFTKLNPLTYVSYFTSLITPTNVFRLFVKAINPFTYVKFMIDLNNPFKWFSWFRSSVSWFGDLFGINLEIKDILLLPFNVIKGLFNFDSLDFSKILELPWSYFKDWWAGSKSCEDQLSIGKPCRQDQVGVQRYYYDENLKACRQFQYAGCGGNRNNFKTRSECESTCRGH